jgi:TP901 family phage tail tape measure protein
VTTLADLVANLRLNASGLQSGLRSAESSLKSTGATLSRTGAAATAGLTLPLVGIGVQAVQLAATFDRTMAQVAVATDAPVGGLEDLAKQLGRDTVFSANEAADAMLELAKGGMTAAQIKSGTLASTLKLAAAGGTSLADAAGFMTVGMKAFSLGAKDADKVTTALTGAANASRVGVADIGVALAQVGTVASQAGQGIDVTTAAIAALTNAGLDGSSAGTGLRGVLASIAGPSKQQAKALHELGVQAFNADGSFKSLDQIAQELQDGLKGMGSEQERTAALTHAFGREGMATAGILADLGSKGFQPYITATNDSQKATDLAAAGMSGMSGALEQMSGAIETAMLGLGQALAPAVIKVAGVVTDLAGKFSELPKSVQTQVAIVGAVLAALGPILIGAGLAFAAIGVAVGALASPIGLAVLALVGLGVAFGVAIAHSEDFRNRVVASLAQIGAQVVPILQDVQTRLTASFAVMSVQVLPPLQQIARTVTTTLLPALMQLSQAFATNVLPVLTLLATVILTTIVPAIARLAAYLVSTLGPVFAQIAGIMSTNVLPLFRTLATFIVGTVVPALVKIVTTVAQNLRPVFDALVGVIRTNLLPQFNQLVVKFREFEPTLETIVKAVLKVVQVLASLASIILGTLLPPILRFIGVLLGGFLSANIAAVGVVFKVIAVIVQAAAAFINALPAIGKFASTIGEKIGAAIGFIKELPGRATSALGNLGSLLAAKGRELVQGFISGILSRIADVKSAASSLVSAVTSFLPGSPAKEGPLSGQGYVLLRGQRMVADLAAGMLSKKGTAKAAAANVIDSLAKTFDLKPFRKLSAAIGDTLTGALQGTSSQVSQAASNLSTLITNAFDARSTTRQSVADDLKSANDKLDKEGEQRKKIVTRIARITADLGKKGANKTALNRELADANGDLKALDGQIATTRGTIKGYTADLAKLDKAPLALRSEKARDALLESIENQQAALDKNAADREELAARIKAATDDLQNAIKTRDDFAAQIASQARSFASVLQFKPEAGQLYTAGDLLADLRARLGALRDYAAGIRDLRNSGLNETTLRQLIDAGPEAAGATVGLLRGAGADVLNELNSLQAQINDQAAGLGGDTSQWFYQAGVDAAQGVVDGLNAQTGPLEDAAKKLAETLTSTVKKALGIASPSKVFRKLMQNVGDGGVLGILDGKTAMADAMQQLVALPNVSRVYGPGLTAGVAAAQQAPAVPTVLAPNVNVQVNGADPALGRSVADSVAWKVRTMTGVVQ